MCISYPSCWQTEASQGIPLCRGASAEQQTDDCLVGVTRSLFLVSQERAPVLACCPNTGLHLDQVKE